MQLVEHEHNIGDLIGLSRLFRGLRQRRATVLAVMVVALFSALTFSHFSTPKYVATARLLRQGTTFDKALFGTRIFEFTSAERSVLSAASQLRLRPVAELVKADLATATKADSLRRMMRAIPSLTADIISISVSSRNPVEAADVANSYARQFILFKQQQTRSILSGALAHVEGRLSGLSPEELGSTLGETLRQRARELSALVSLQTGEYEIAENASVPAAASSPGVILNVLVACVLGLGVGLLLVAFLESVDRRVKDPQTAEVQFGLPVLAQVNDGRKTRGKASVTALIELNPRSIVGPRAEVIEPFRVLRASLRFVEASGPARSILVTSSVPREGKTFTTAYLALSLALAGSRVLMMEGDLRKPMLRQCLGLKAEAGVTEVLLGTRSPAEVIQSINIGNSGELFLMPAGSAPPNPAELLANGAKELVSAVLRDFDYVVVDAPPLLAASDAIELSKAVDAVLLVARLGLVQSPQIEHVRATFKNIGIKPIGLVVTGASTRRARSRRYRSAMPGLRIAP